MSAFEQRRSLLPWMRPGYVKTVLPLEDVDVLVFGDIHLPYVASDHGLLVLDPGSVGFNLDGDLRTSYMILDIQPDSVVVEHRRVGYDVQAAVKDVGRAHADSELGRQRGGSFSSLIRGGRQGPFSWTTEWGRTRWSVPVSVAEFWARKDAGRFDTASRIGGRCRAISRMATVAQPYLSRQGCVTIDLGCGTGLFEEAVGIRSVTGVDFSPSLVVLARTRMDTVWEKDIFKIQLRSGTIDNVVSLFVIDDYPTQDKLVFFRDVFSYLKPGGHFFFAAYSPRDERMGRLRETINRKANTKVNVYLEEASFYRRSLTDCGFAVNSVETLQAEGAYQTSPDQEEMKVRREFVLIVAGKPRTIQKT